MSQQAMNEFYKDEEEMVMDYAAAVNAEARDLEKAGADIIQLDEPWLRNDPEAAKRFAVKAINRALERRKYSRTRRWRSATAIHVSTRNGSATCHRLPYIDVSFSQETTLPTEKAAARAFIERVIDSHKDQVAIIPFTGLAYLEQPMTRDLLSVYSVLQRIEVAVPAYLGAGRPLTGIPTGPGLPAPPEEGTTAIWDAVALTSSSVLANAPGIRRRAIILLTDGLNTTGRLSQKQAIDRVLAAEAVVYAIGIGSEKDGLDRGVLRDIAQRTGGRAFFPHKKFDLNAAFAEIEKELRTQYLIAYSSTNKKRDGAYRKVSIEITNPQLKKEKLEIRHRPGYYAKN